MSAERQPSAGRRILFLTTSCSWDGPGRALAAILSHWPEGDALGLCVLKTVEPAFERALPAGVAVRALGMRHVADASALARLWRHCRAWEPDLIHTQLSRADWLGRLVGSRLDVPIVSTIQNVHSRMYRAEFRPVVGRAAMTLDQLTGRLASHFIAVSPGVRADLVDNGVPAERVTVVANPFDPGRSPRESQRADARARFRVDETHIVIGTVALLKAQKGIGDLVAAARLVAAREPRVRFVHVGGGPLEADVKRAIRDAGLESVFQLMGWVDDPLTLLPGMDVFALPSHWEGLPIALLEAMAANVPAVGTRVAGIEDVIIDRETGLLVPPRDPAALAAALLEVVGSPDLGAQLAERARARLAIYDARPIARATRLVHTHVLGAGRR